MIHALTGQWDPERLAVGNACSRQNFLFFSRRKNKSNSCRESFLCSHVYCASSLDQKGTRRQGRAGLQNKRSRWQTGGGREKGCSAPALPMSPASDDGFRFGVKNQKRGEGSAVRRGRLRKNMVQRRQQQHRTRPAQQMSDGFSRLKEQRINEWEAMSGKEDSEQRKNMIKQSNDLFLAALLSPTAIKTRLRFA